MSKSVLLSIKPKYCELIASGKKTVEVRKTRPKIDVLFKCYIYCTKDKGISFWTGKRYAYADDRSHNLFDVCGNGKVIGEFMCDGIIPISIEYSNPNSRIALKEFPYTCLTDKEIMDYLGNGKTGYGFHISDLVIYDKPRDLDDFMAFGKSNCDCKNCDNCLYMGIDGICDIKDSYQPLFRPPQSWCYVEELG